MSVPQLPRVDIPPAIFWRNLSICVLGAPLIVVLPLAVVGLIHGWITVLHGSGSYLTSLICLVPFLQSLSFGILGGRYRVSGRYFGAGAAIFAADLLIGFVLLHEGVICLIIASPIFLAIIAMGLAIGVTVGSLVLRPTLRASFIPFALLGVVYDAQTGPPSHASIVADAVTIEAPPDYVWRYIVSYPENRAPADYWLWQLGLPLPVQSVAAEAEIGAPRECRFSGGAVLREKITELVPNKVMTFVVTEQPSDPEILGHVALDKGQLYLVPNADGSTTVIATSWYRLFVSPATYFDWWASDIARNIHRRVLDQVKRLAEGDWLREHPNETLKPGGS